jgi:hypothetical protein
LTLFLQSTQEFKKVRNLQQYMSRHGETAAMLLELADAQAAYNAAKAATRQNMV